MKTENLSTLKINKLTQAQYNRELDAGRIDENALYLTPATDSVIDILGYMPSHINISKADEEDNYSSSYASFAPFNSSKTVNVTTQKGNITCKTISEVLPDRNTEVELYAIEIGDDIHTVRVSANICYYTSDSTGCNLHTYLQHKYTDVVNGNSQSFDVNEARTSCYIHSDGYVTHCIDTIVDVSNGDILYVYARKGVTSRNIDVHGESNTSNWYKCTQMSVQAIG